MPIIIEPTDRQHWLDLRTEDITSTEIAALYGESPYQTEFELFHHKKQRTYSEIEDNDRMKWGRRLQDVIAAGIAEDEGWQVKPLTAYMRHDTQRGMGSSFDYEVVFEDGVVGVMEVKNVDFVQHRDNWIDDGPHSEAPVHIEFQLQHQLEIIKYERGVVAALVSGNKPTKIIRDRDHEMGANFCTRVEKFWSDLETGNLPAPDFLRDTELLKELYSNSNGKTVVLTESNRAQELCSEFWLTREMACKVGDRHIAARNELLTIIGDNEKAIVGDYVVSAAVIERAGFTVEPATYRNMRISRKK